MFQVLEEFDRWLFLLLNGLHHPVLDELMVLISSKWMWIPFYIFLLYVIIKNFGKNSLFIIIGVGLLIGLCDQLSVHLFKNVFMRFRPCHNLEIQNLVHIVNDHCGGQYGFVSSHAANAFGLAYFIGRILQRLDRNWLTLMISWAILVSYSRIYLGVHYPSDIIGGAALGIFVAIILLRMLSLLSKNYSWNIFDK